ncbi:MAG: dual-action ribosomal maturation protein DarP, partial [Ottowia sp.]
AAQDTLLLHAAEDWRERLAAPDAAASQAALNEWMARFAQTDAQQLRALIRQARKDRAQAAAVASAPGQGVRQGRAWRELFQLIRGMLNEERA